MDGESYYRNPEVLPFRRFYSIEVGNKHFSISGESLSSDAPSYFTRYFQNIENEGTTLVIDRNPVIFEKLYSHLQGYQVNIESDYEFMYMWQDSNYFGLQKLRKFLELKNIYATIGDTSFRIPRNLLIDTKNFPNYFTNSYDSALFNKVPSHSNDLVRLPQQGPLTVANRSPKLFGNLLELLRGNLNVIKDNCHRKQLIVESRFYGFLALEQRIINCKVLDNPFNSRKEIIIHLSDIKREGILVSSPTGNKKNIQYRRPYLPNEPIYDLILQINGSDDPNEIGCGSAKDVTIVIYKSLVMVQLSNQTCKIFDQLFAGFIKNYLARSMQNSESYIRIYMGEGECNATVNGMQMSKDWISHMSTSISSIPSGQVLSVSNFQTEDKKIEIKVMKSLWRIKIVDEIPRFHPILLEGVTDENSFINQSVSFI